MWYYLFTLLVPRRQMGLLHGLRMTRWENEVLMDCNWKGKEQKKPEKKAVLELLWPQEISSRCWRHSFTWFSREKILCSKNWSGFREVDSEGTVWQEFFHTEVTNSSPHTTSTFTNTQKKQSFFVNVGEPESLSLRLTKTRIPQG